MSEQRRRQLGIPVHEDDQHQWRADGYCNCGAQGPKAPRGKPHRFAPFLGVVRPSNLDTIEGNEVGR